ncbi:MAG: GGDEF domain-containing protein [Acidimicrobiia bacterium]|nr:GGDEF domain-containing protein [Acidimicrobiia bacterium]
MAIETGQHTGGLWARPEVVRPEDYRLYMTIFSVGALGILVHLALIVVFPMIGFGWLGLVNVISSAAWATAWLLNRRGFHFAAMAIMTIEVAAHTALATSALGWSAGFQYHLLGAVPITLFNNRMRTSTGIGLVVTLAALFVVLYAAFGDAIAPGVSDAWVGTLHTANALVAFAAAGIASHFFRLASVAAEQQMETLASIDALTGVYNRRRMRELLDAQANLAERHDAGFALIMADIDRFKDFNDTHGHAFGDRILREVAQIVEERLRQYDSVARWGGEEFLIMLPDADADGARAVADTVHKAVEQYTVEHHGEQVGVTMTLGVAMHRSGDDVEDTIRSADGAMYHGKQAGRNRVVFDEV